MFKGFYNLTSGMITQGRKLDVISNNMTNVATAGFKADRFTASTFQDMLWSRTGNKAKQYEELGRESFITAPDALVTDQTQGSFDETGLPFDFAINGEGFFALDTGEGRVYTRSGTFSLDDEGYLWYSNKGRVLDVAGEPMQIITEHIECDSYGGIYTQDGNFLGRLGVYVFEDLTQLEKDAQGFFTSEQQPTPGQPTIYHGMTERSNADMIQQMTEMISSQRAYQSAAEVIKIYDDLINKATTEVGRL